MGLHSGPRRCRSVPLGSAFTRCEARVVKRFDQPVLGFQFGSFNSTIKTRDADLSTFSTSCHSASNHATWPIFVLPLGFDTLPSSCVICPLNSLRKMSRWRG